MFARADQLRIIEIQDSLPIHAISYDWDEFEPELLIFDTRDEELSSMQFDDHLSISVSKKRTCVGAFVEGGYIPCPDHVSVSRFSQCQECGKQLIPIQECLFEPKCDGELCDSPICRREHAIYIAFFGAKPKIGMTLKNRVRRRLIEQGADAYAVVGTFGTRMSARNQEKTFSRKLRITERPASSTILKSLHISSKRQQIEDISAGLLETLESGLSMKPGRLNFLDDYPLEEPLAQVPKLIESWGMHSGKLLGIKGKFLIYDSGRLSAIDLSRLPSRFLSGEGL